MGQIIRLHELDSLVADVKAGNTRGAQSHLDAALEDLARVENVFDNCAVAVSKMTHARRTFFKMSDEARREPLALIESAAFPDLSDAVHGAAVWIREATGIGRDEAFTAAISAATK